MSECKNPAAWGPASEEAGFTIRKCEGCLGPRYYYHLVRHADGGDQVYRAWSLYEAIQTFNNNHPLKENTMEYKPMPDARFVRSSDWNDGNYPGAVWEILPDQGGASEGYVKVRALGFRNNPWPEGHETKIPLSADPDWNWVDAGDVIRFKVGDLIHNPNGSNKDYVYEVKAINDGCITLNHTNVGEIKRGNAQFGPFYWRYDMDRYHIHTPVEQRNDYNKENSTMTEENTNMTTATDNLIERKNQRIDRLVKDLEIIGEELLQEANDQDWCDVYDNRVAEVNNKLSEPWLRPRRREYTMTVTVNFDVEAGLDDIDDVASDIRFDLEGVFAGGFSGSVVDWDYEEA